MRWNSIYLLVTLIGLAIIHFPSVAAQENKAQADNAEKKTVEPDSKPAVTEELPREQRLANYLTGSKFVGAFTVDRGEPGKLKEESYEISKCEKLPEKDMYRLTARIKYGDTDGEFPMDLKILWSGDTPVITLDQLWIPGLGTFSARVLILNGRYAGTWDHGPVGGHLFGRVEKPKTEN
jgi:hypothetical protein